MSIFGKLWHLLAPSHRRSAFALLGLMLIGMVLETIGIGLVIPAMALMTQGDLSSKYPAIVPLLIKIGDPGHNRLVIGGMLVLVVVYAVKAAFIAFLSWRQARYITSLQVDFSQRLFAGYLRQPYTFHLQRNSAQLIHNTLGQSSGLAGVIHQCLILVTEVLVMLGISTLMLKVEPLGTLITASVLGLAGWIFNRVTRAHILRWGKSYQYHERLRIQHLQQGLGGVKDVKLLGREADFLAQYQSHNVSSASVSERQMTLGALPRLWLELLAVTGMAILVFAMIMQGKPIEGLLPTLGLFGAAAFRLIPSVNRVLAAVQNMRFSMPVIDTIYGELKLLEEKSAPQREHRLTFKNVLTVDQVNFQYPMAEAQALRGISLEIPHGASIGFIGGSGAGKSTLVDIILGLLTPVSGAVRIDGVDIQNNLRGWQDQIGYVPQSIFLTDDSLRRNVAFGLPEEQIDTAAVWRAIHAAQLGQFVNDLPQGLDTMVGERGVRLSGGQRQRIGIARALYHDPPVLVLDEATSSLDTLTERGVMDAVRALQGNKTVIIVAHRLSTVGYCDHVYRMESGRVADKGTTKAMLSKVAVPLSEPNQP